VNAQIAAKQLYHDREEITVHVRRIWAATSPKANAYRRYRDDE
ncbi:MAG: 23S rRNA (cytidine(2498)-2'-O)-methyltransferase RlmM, partial [Plesiomonas shigelloides]